MKLYCKYCKEEVPGNEEICPNCGILLYDKNKSDVFICKICGFENSISNTKCNYCCSIINIGTSLLK